MNTHRLTRETGRSLLWMLALGIGMVSLGLGAAVFLGNAIAHPLDRIGVRMHDISEGEGDLTVQLEVPGEDEIARLSTHFNRFVGNIRGILRETTRTVEELSRAAENLDTLATRFKVQPNDSKLMFLYSIPGESVNWNRGCEL
jgi:methyl-accepting chemotaxis protein